MNFSFFLNMKKKTNQANKQKKNYNYNKLNCLVYANNLYFIFKICHIYYYHYYK
jgi:hypothetical protein